MIFHVLNRGNTRDRILDNDADYAAFEKVLAETQAQVFLRILSDCLMPNHWRLVLWPLQDGDLGQESTAKQLGLESTFRSRGGPKKGLGKRLKVRNSPLLDLSTFPAQGDCQWHANPVPCVEACPFSFTSIVPPRRRFLTPWYPAMDHPAEMAETGRDA